MEFFDAKKDVLDVKLTSYGRHLLSKGRLKPAYYAFFDDDIIYDSNFFYKKNLEHQNDIQDRILSESIRTKQQTNYTGVETNIKKQIKAIKNKASMSSGSDLVHGVQRNPLNVNMQHELERDYALGMPIGKTSVLNDLPPSFKLLLLAGEIANHSETYEDPNLGTAMRIPQLDIDVEYNITAHFIENQTKDELRRLAGAKNHHVEFSPTFEDGSYLKIEGKHILLMLEEMNVDIGTDSFEIEVLEETKEPKRVHKKDEHGNVYIDIEQHSTYIPMFFDPGSMTSFNVTSEEGVENLVENIVEPIQGSVNSIFHIKSDNELSVPIGLLSSALISPQDISNSLQQGDSLFLSKPLLKVPMSEFPDTQSYGKLYHQESNIYITGEVLSGDPEECE